MTPFSGSSSDGAAIEPLRRAHRPRMLEEAMPSELSASTLNESIATARSYAAIAFGRSSLVEYAPSTS